MITLLALPVNAWAVSGIIVEAKGDVRVTLEDKQLNKPQSGTELSDGAVVKTGTDGNAVILLSNGQMHRLSPNSNHSMKTDGQTKGNVPIVRGISIALNEVARKDKDQAVHAMVKAPGKKFELTPARKVKLDEDLKTVDQINLHTAEGGKLLKAQVYYKYRQYDQALGLLKEISDSQKEPSPLVLSLILMVEAKR